MNFTHEDLSRLASFPEQNPNPVVEISGEGKIVYHNPAAKRMFPDIIEKGIDHPLFRSVQKEISKGNREGLTSFICEVEIGERVFEQKLFFISSNEAIRVYSSDITKQKENERKLANLALFPEQNPNPVIEVNADDGEITYRNPAAIKTFPDLKEKGIKHPLLMGVNTSEKKDFQREIELDHHAFEQKIYFIEGSHLIRVYSHDITEQKKILKNLSRLASFPELNPSPIVEVNLEGIITYVNPACKKTFPEIPDQKLSHPVLAPLIERFDKLRSGVIDNYVDKDIQ
jgi:PAS domain-containing protein